MQRKEKIQLGVIGVSVLIIVAVSAPRYLKKKNVYVQPVMAAPKHIVAPQSSSGQQLFLSLQTEADKLGLHRDPFSTRIIRLPGEFFLSGILWDTENSTAIVNNVVVRIGSVVEGYKVLDIQKDKVILSNGTKTVNLVVGE